MKIKNRVLLLIVLCLLFLAGTAAGASSSVVKNISATIYPNLTLYFKGEKELPSTERPGYYWTGSEWVPKAMIYNGTTYVPLRYFATKMGIPNEQIGWDPATPSIWVGSEKPAELVQQPVANVPPETTNGIGVFGVALGDSQDHVKQALGEPSRIDYESTGQYWSYTSDYANYVLLYMRNGTVNIIFTTAKNWKYKDLKSGMTIQDINKVQINGFMNQKNGIFYDKTNKISLVAIPEVFYARYELIFPSLDKTSEPLRLFDAINGIRVAQGVSALTWSENAARVAEEHSKDLQSHHICGHDSSNGDDITKRKENTKTQYGFTFGENVVCDADFTFSIGQWLSSPGHLKNMLSPYKSTGVGISGRTYTQLFLSQ